MLQKYKKIRTLQNKVRKIFIFLLPSYIFPLTPLSSIRRF